MNSDTKSIEATLGELLKDALYSKIDSLRVDANKADSFADDRQMQAYVVSGRLQNIQDELERATDRWFTASEEVNDLLVNWDELGSSERKERVEKLHRIIGSD